MATVSCGLLERSALAGVPDGDSRLSAPLLILRRGRRDDDDDRRRKGAYSSFLALVRRRGPAVVESPCRRQALDPFDGKVN